jgi:hypothetical protein
LAEAPARRPAWAEDLKSARRPWPAQSAGRTPRPWPPSPARACSA